MKNKDRDNQHRRRREAGDPDHDPERALRPNLARRDFSSGAKREAVKQYLLAHYDGEREQQAIADDLGVAIGTVNTALQELRESGKQFKDESFSTDEKREIVRGYIEEHPSASNRDVADAVEPEG